MGNFHQDFLWNLTKLLRANIDFFYMQYILYNFLRSKKTISIFYRLSAWPRKPFSDSQKNPSVWEMLNEAFLDQMRRENEFSFRFGLLFHMSNSSTSIFHSHLVNIDRQKLRNSHDGNYYHQFDIFTLRNSSWCKKLATILLQERDFWPTEPQIFEIIANWLSTLDNLKSEVLLVIFWASNQKFLATFIRFAKSCSFTFDPKMVENLAALGLDSKKILRNFILSLSIIFGNPDIATTSK